MKKGYCRWCGCWKRAHTGQPSQTTRGAFPTVKWTTTACSNLLHEHADVKACRTYEI